MIAASRLIDASADRDNVALADVVFVEDVDKSAGKKAHVTHRHTDVQDLFGARYFHEADLLSDRDINRGIGLESSAEHFLHLTGRSASPEKRAVLSITCINNLTQVGVPQRVLAVVNDLWALAA